MTLLFICDDSKMQLMVNGTIDDLIEPANALRELRPFTTFDSATTWLKDRPQNRPPPTAVLIDPQTGRQGAQDTRAFLNELSAKELHAVVALRAPGSEFDIEGVRNPRVWTWDTSAATDGEKGPEERLIEALLAASRPEVPRHFRVTVNFAGDAVTLTVEENGVTVIRKRPLLTDAGARATLESVVNADFEPLEAGNSRETWRRYKLSGYTVFNALFGDIGKALISDDPSETVEFRFEIEPVQLARRFALPLELITRVANDSHDSFLCNLRPMARCIPSTRPRLASLAHVQHILFLDAGSAEGAMSILGAFEPEDRALRSIAVSTAAQRTRLEDMRATGLCTLELLTLEEFNKRAVPKAPSLLEAVRRRLCEPRNDDPAIDILHFAGHGITRVDTETRLVLPGEQPRQVELLEVKQLAEWLPSSVRHVFLAACQTASVSSAAHLHYDKGCSLVGFRWKVVAQRIPDFVLAFYEAHLRERKSVAAAYRSACQRARLPEDPAYVSAVALSAD
jgi:hypothetical protein